MSVARCDVLQAMLTEHAVILVVDAHDDPAAASSLRLRQSVIDPADLASGQVPPCRVEEKRCATVEESGPLLRLLYARTTPGTVLRSLEIVADETLLVTVEPRTQLSMAFSFPLDDDEFSKAFSGRKSRWQDTRSNYLIARQICLHFTGSAAYRCAAGVVLGYKAAETGDPGMGQEALAIARQLLPLADSCPRHWHPRRNGEQLSVSLLMAMWHVQLSLNDIASFRVTLDSLVERHATITNYLTASNAMCRSLLLYGYFLLRTGETERGRSILRLSVEAFQRGAADIDVRRISFLKDLEASHRAAVLAAEAIRATPAAAEIAGDAILTECLRVSGNAFSRLKKSFAAAGPTLTGGSAVPI